MSEKVFEIKVQKERGTKLVRNGAKPLRLSLQVSDPPKNTSSIEHLFSPFKTVIAIIDEIISPVANLGIRGKNGFIITIPPQTPYMIMNISAVDIILNYSLDPSAHQIIYDPYLMEHASHADIDPNEFKKAHPVPNGYIDTLAKWYSVKYTYPDVNYIFVRPGLGISIQTHRQREEHWEVLQGSPLIIAGNKVYYKTTPGQKFTIPIGAYHTVINPTKDWILIKEGYAGTFDEKDIARIYNPNNYQS